MTSTQTQDEAFGLCDRLRALIDRAGDVATERLAKCGDACLWDHRRRWLADKDAQFVGPKARAVIEALEDGLNRIAAVGLRRYH